MLRAALAASHSRACAATGSVACSREREADAALEDAAELSLPLVGASVRPYAADYVLCRPRTLFARCLQCPSEEAHRETARASPLITAVPCVPALRCHRVSPDPTNRSENRSVFVVLTLGSGAAQQVARFRF